MTEYVWKSPGGLYVVPDDFKRRFLAEFPSYRIRWSLSKGCWCVEQQIQGETLIPFRFDEGNDDLVRFRDGFSLVMEFQPGDRMACPARLDAKQVCGWPMKVTHRQSKESRCEACRLRGRDGRTMAAYWPFDECLLDHLRWSDPLRDGTMRVSAFADKVNRDIKREKDRRSRDAWSSLDSVDYRWLAGIASSTGCQRKYIDEKDLT